MPFPIFSTIIKKLGFLPLSILKKKPWLLCFGFYLPLTGISQIDTFTIENFDRLWNYRDPAATESKFLELLETVKNSNNASFQTELYSQIARTQGLQRKFDTAHQTLDLAEKLLLNGNARSEIRYLLERGRVFNSSGDKLKAISFFTQAWEKALESNEDNLAVDAAHMLGIAETPEKQLEWNEKAMNLAEESEDKKTRNWLGPLYNNIGWTYHDMGNFEKALELFEKSLEWRVSKEDENGIFIAKWCIARTFRSLNRIEDALMMQMKLLQEIEEKQLEPDGYVYEEIGECMLIQGKENDARFYFLKAYELLSKDQWLVNNEPARINRIKELAKIKEAED